MVLTFHEYLYIVVSGDCLVGGDWGKEGVANLTTLITDRVTLDRVLAQTEHTLGVNSSNMMLW